mgnify:CR=1 FL=1
MPDINSDIQYLKGVGPAYAKKFAKLGIYTIRDLLLHYPRRYIDYSQPYTVVSAPFDVDCCVKATVLQRDPDRRIKGGRMLSHVLAGDDTGMLALSWFNAPYAAEKLEPGTEYYFEGRVGGMMTRREILHPLVRTEAQVAAAPLLPVYGSTEGLPAARLTRCAQLALEYVAQLDDPLPPELLTRYRMPPKADAVRAIHAPRDAADAAAARRRLIFEELYILQLGIFLMRGHGRKITGAPMRELDLAPFWRSLPYAPTGAQRRSAEEICHDLCGQTPMNRLLQGDVGSGKTLVAAAAIWFAAQNGWQSAMLAPTEILARQHAANLADRLEPFGVNVMLMSPHADDVAKVVVEEGIKVVTTGAGNPGKYMEMWKAAGIKVIPVVASVALARMMEKGGADAVIAEGMESGGHIGEATTMTLVPQIVDAVSIPVIAAGGIGDGRGIAAAFMLGAEAVQMGTRFVVAKESIVHPGYKERIIKAKDIDSTVTGRTHGHPVRCLRNQMTREYIKLEQEGKSFEELEYLTLGTLRKAVMEGDTVNGTVMAGQIAGMIKKEQTCKEMIDEMMAEAGRLLHW